VTHEQPGRTRPQAPWLRIRAVRWAVARFGWRAYAVPFLMALSIAVVVHPAQGSATAGRAAANGPAPAATSTAPSPSTSSDPSLDEDAATGSDPASSSAPPASAAAPTPTPTPTATPCAGTTDDQLVLVSISQQHAWMCSAGAEVKDSAVTTGEVDNGDQTPTGTWQVYAKQTDRYLTGPGYSDYVNFWVPFNGDFGFHDASWQTMAYGSPDYVTQGSHGCVHLPIDVMTWMYNWIAVGATVTVAA
jgi:lipoprotein-anchoring transpeptidase ErfK/SrfK